ncbi:bifunctional 3-demethylubiquinone-9 3-methyltransferase/ 2-octaprenyl-6-hydroxy phenol methylase [Candidatus Nitrosocosmicus oleophilus]|uniref:Bifunctional 3-demethylubiquinone-9 3-methyltransferase/ 2-octaprenyl-6-hydroxy phenol methylase n=2 Tax=Candidatus Nitrosocosmicus oleophilus TaxID=1353260 RepID=A0A654LX86_9ARCH|nr:bifunctional 3-demethylubiquinone-9 3-methyltransferase/ 2-octaprenyl-6-hydroxy phenol methylase [Candidatus Nitrosocosmicus oleophilus]
MDMNSNSSNAFDSKKLEEFVTQAISDLGCSLGSMMIILGDRLGLYKALSRFGPMTSEELAHNTNTAERYIREWLASQAAAGYLTYDPENKKFTLSAENAMVLADENSPAYLLGGYQVLRSIFKDEDKFVKIFQTGEGLRWGDHHHDLYEGTAKFFRPNYMSNLVQFWIPALDGIEQILRKGGKVADIGCGYGISTTIMAQQYPNSRFFGFDNHLPSIEAATANAKNEKLDKNVKFSQVSANEPIGNDYDFVTFFDCLHDMGDPLGALKFAKQSLKPDGSCMIVEPMANDKIEDNLNMVGRIYYAASSIICVPNSLADKGIALGAQAGENMVRNLALEAGFTKFRRATQTPFNIIYEAK